MAGTPNAAAVSRALKRQGFSPLPSGTVRRREGIRVSQSPRHVAVTVDLDNASRATELADDLFQALVASKYHVERMATNRLWVLARLDDPATTPATLVHRANVTRRGSGWGWRCSCGEEPNRSTRNRRTAEGWAKDHERAHA